MKTRSDSESVLFTARAFIITCVCFVGVCLSFAGTIKPARKTAADASHKLASHTLALTSQPSGTATFNGIGFVPGYNSSEVRATTADGSVAIGGSGLANPPGAENGRVAVQWTSAGGLVTLPQIPYDGTPGGGSPDGTGNNFIVGSDITASGSWIAYRARPGYPNPNQLGRREAVICSGDFSQVIPLGRLAANRRSVANQISDDGSIAFGFAEDVNVNTQVFRWTQATGMQLLPIPPGYPAPPAYDNANTPAGRACSADGSVSVGILSAYDANTGDEFDVQAYRWTQATGIQLLGYLPGGNRSAALAISGDGSTIFGVTRSTNAPGTGQTNPWDYSGELFVWTSANGMTPLGVPVGYDVFTNFAGMSADGALLATFAGDSTHTHSDSFFVIQTATQQAFDAYDLLATAGAGPAISGWSEVTPLGMSDNGDTLFGSAIDPNGLQQGWVANFPIGYLRTVQTFNAMNPNVNVTITGAFIGRDGNYATRDLNIGGQSLVVGGQPSVGGPSLTLSGTATLSVNGTLTVNSDGVLNLLGTATVTAQALDLLGGATLGIEIDSSAENISRLAISNGPIDLTGQPTLNLIVTYPAPGSTAFTIIHNTTGQPIQGHFSGLPEGGTFLAGTRRFQVTYSGGSGHDFVVTVLPGPPVSSAVSRLMHGGLGPFDINLPLSGPAGIECRSSASLGVGNYTIVLTFVNNLTSVGSTRVASGTGSVSSTTMGPGQNQYTVNLTGVANAQYLTVTLTNVVDSQNNEGDISVPMAILIGDANGNGTVNAGDVAQTKGRLGQTVGATNFRSDVNANGTLNAGDVAIVKSNLGTGLP